MANAGWAFSADAATDFDQIAAFSLDRFGQKTTDAYLSGLENACERLVGFPRLGRTDPKLDSSIRILSFRSHRIFYRVEPTRVLILRILHHARNTPTEL